ncbi:Putative uncharacterized protein [Halomonas sp. R57-5]|nr:Putative uncharacterized protein [Halomonas sp. R57-5]
MTFKAPYPLSAVDKAYFLEVVEALEGQSVIWTVVVKTHDEDTRTIQCPNDFGICREHIYCKLWSEL